MAKSPEVIAANKAARRASTERDHERKAEAEEAARLTQVATRFNPRSTRDSVEKSIVNDGALTRDEYDVAAKRGLAGPVTEPHLRTPFDVAAAREWTGTPALTELSKSRATSPDTNDGIAPDSYEPTAEEIAALRHGDEAARRQQQAMGWNDDDEDQEDDSPVDELTDEEVACDYGRLDDDRYDEMTWNYGFDGIEAGRPEWDTDDPGPQYEAYPVSEH